MKLFELTTPNGQVIVGYNPSKCRCKSENEFLECNHFDCERMIIDQLGINETTLGTLSDITEKQCKEWGYEFDTKHEMKNYLMLQSRIQNDLGKYDSMTEFIKYSNLFDSILLIQLT